MNTPYLEQLAKLIRTYILTSTTQAGSGHATSSLSAVELMVGLLFSGVFRFDVQNPSAPNNDRLIFSKGHAAPLLYALWAAAGAIPSEELSTLRKFGSRLEGHPTPAFPFAEVATGSLGQGLSVGVGMALNGKYLDTLPYRTYVLLGDSEMAEGAVWEAIQIAAHYKLNNLIGIIDVNRLGQRGETMYGHNLSAYQQRISAFGWETIMVGDGHAVPEIIAAYQKAAALKEKPVMVIAKTIKGKGVSFVEDKEGWHGKVLTKEELRVALAQLGTVDFSARGTIGLPEREAISHPIICVPPEVPEFYEQALATRKAYGHALIKIYPRYPAMVVLDAEMSNSTYAEMFKNVCPHNFFEMFLTEQNMVSVALGLAARGKIPFVSTFAAFLPRAFDQIRMAQYSREKAKIIFIGSHAGSATGQDGPSQMGLEDIAMFRSIHHSTILYPADHVATEKLLEVAVRTKGLVYVRVTKFEAPPLYQEGEEFLLGGSKTLRQSQNDVITVVAAGITVFEALAAYDELQKENIAIRVIDLYSVKPIDEATLNKAAHETNAMIVVEDHVPEGGIGEAVQSTLAAEKIPVYSLAVRKLPKSGTPQELLDYEEISKGAITRLVKRLVKDYETKEFNL
ncbi:transketolase [Candidatus Gottesmanbacteria bacterium]|nr:transketolase [Candidatus Gottesmanbacteria bacterium]